MPKCDKCDNEASRSTTWDMGNGETVTIWYCKNHSRRIVGEP